MDKATNYNLIKRKKRLEERVNYIANKKNPSNDELHTLFNLCEAIGEIQDHLEVIYYGV